MTRRIRCTGSGFAAAALVWAGVTCVGAGNAWAGPDLPTLRLECKGGVFTPARLEVAAGTKFKIEIFNTGSDAIEFESLDLRKEKALNPGGSSFVVVYPLAPGEYRFFDDFHSKGGGGTIVAH
jgi:plastocyanin